MYEYSVKLRVAEEGGFVVFIPAFDAYTQGEDVDDALANAQDALDELLAFHITDGLPIPSPDRGRSRYAVEPSPYIVLKAALHEAMQQAGLSKNALARRLGVAENEVRRST